MGGSNVFRKEFSRRDFLKVGGAGFAGAALLGVAGCGAGGGGSEQGGGGGEVREFRYAFEGPEKTTHGIAADIFQKALEDASGGRMTIKQFPAAQLGGEPELLEKVRSGDIDFVNSSTANAAAIVPQAGVFSLHYLFESKDHIANALSDREVVKVFREMVSESVEGAQALTLYTLPLRNIYAKETEVRTVDDIKGKKIRVQATKTEDVTFKAYGAQTVHMAFPEVYTALQTGVVDMAENAVTYYGINKHYEVAPVMSMTQHAGNTQTIWVTDKVWNSLSKEEKGWVQAAADEVGQKATLQGFELEKEKKEEYSELGVKFFENVDRDSFRQIAQPLQDELARDLGDYAVELVDLIRGLR
ncbi:MAG: TRAP transporter substrate-binding protein [Rubrobacter sp.]|nr:TRAP transporter substrate-binding protein [Rubrobacter sp.]